MLCFALCSDEVNLHSLLLYLNSLNPYLSMFEYMRCFGYDLHVYVYLRDFVMIVLATEHMLWVHFPFGNTSFWEDMEDLRSCGPYLYSVPTAEP